MAKQRRNPPVMACPGGVVSLYTDVCAPDMQKGVQVQPKVFPMQSFGGEMIHHEELGVSLFAKGFNHHTTDEYASAVLDLVQFCSIPDLQRHGRDEHHHPALQPLLKKLYKMLYAPITTVNARGLILELKRKAGAVRFVTRLPTTHRTLYQSDHLDTANWLTPLLDQEEPDGVSRKQPDRWTQYAMDKALESFPMYNAMAVMAWPENMTPLMLLDKHSTHMRLDSEVQESDSKWTRMLKRDYQLALQRGFYFES